MGLRAWSQQHLLAELNSLPTTSNHVRQYIFKSTELSRNENKTAKEYNHPPEVLRTCCEQTCYCNQ